MDSNIKIIRLSPEDLGVISDLDAFYRGDIINSSVGFGIGALYETEDDIVMTGLVIGTVMGKDLTIEWMAVDNEFQSQLIGGELLFEIFDMAAATGVERVHAVIHDQYEKAKICRGADKYFRQHIFYEEKAIGDDVLTDLGTIAKSKFMKKPVVEMMPTVLSQVSKKDRHDILTTLAGKKDAICFFDLMSISGGLDDDISIVFYHNDTIVGGLLVYDAGSVLIPVYLWRKADEVFNPLVIYCFKLTAKKYDRPKKVLVTQRDDRMPAIAKKVLGESSKARLLTASVEEYKSLDTKPE